MDPLAPVWTGHKGVLAIGVDLSLDDEQQRHARALQLCDVAGRAISEGPIGWQTGLPISVDDLRIEQRGFMRLARRAAGRPDPPDEFADGIDIFWREAKVLSVGLSRTGDRRVLCYEPGEWEGKLELLLTPGRGRVQ